MFGARFKRIFETSVFKTLRFNLRYFGIKGLRLPVLVSRNYKLQNLGGIVELGDFSTGAVRLGYSGVGIFDARFDRGIWSNDGRVVFSGGAFLGQGSKVSCRGVLAFGAGFRNTAKGEFVCHGSTSFGKGCLVSWDALFMDTDFHSVDGNDPMGSIEVGDGVWVGCRSVVLKGASIPDRAIVAANSVIAKHVEGQSPLVVQFGRVVRTGVDWAE